MKKTAGLLLLFGCVLVAADFWQKPYTEWSDKDAAKMMNSSPWAKSASVAMSFPGGGAGASDLRRPQADEPKAGRGDVVSVGIPEVTGPAQVDDRLDDLHDQRRDEGLIQARGRGGGSAEPPVHRLQLRPLRPERRKLLPLHLRHQV